MSFPSIRHSILGFASAAAVACASVEPLTAADCVPYYDGCATCSPACATQEDLDDRSTCELGCPTAEPDWTCEVVDDACAVAPTS